MTILAGIAGRVMTDDAKQVTVSIGDRAVSWVMGISAVATFAFAAWIATTMIEVRTAVGHLSDQLANIRETRQDAFILVRDRLDHLSERVKQLESAVEGLRRYPEERER